MQPTGFEPETAVFGWSKIPRGGAGNFCLHHRIQNGSGATHPPIQWEQGVFSLGVELPGREAEHLVPRLRMRAVKRSPLHPTLRRGA